MLANCAGQLSSGYGIGYLGTHGKEVKADLAMSDTDIAWAVSSLLVGGIPGCLVAGRMADKIGRRKRSNNVSILVEDFDIEKHLERNRRITSNKAKTIQ